MTWTTKQQEELHKKHLEIHEDNFDIIDYLDENSHNAYDETGYAYEVYNIGFGRGYHQAIKFVREKFKEMQNCKEDIYTNKEWKEYYNIIKQSLNYNEGIGKNTYNESYTNKEEENNDN